ncbi:MAG: helix-turn-helix transcriptional regulator [bacterium]|nr:helix-turn-helix transcriptional regulator [bacterium]
MSTETRVTKNKIYRQKVGRRLEKVRKYLGLDRNTMAARMNITPWTYSRQRDGKHLPLLSSLNYLVKTQSLSLDWLYTGRGEMVFRAIDIEAELRLAAEETMQKLAAARKSPLQDDLDELVRLVNTVPAIRYDLMGYFHKLKEQHKDLLPEQTQTDAVKRDENTTSTDTSPKGEEKSVTGITQTEKEP